MSTDDTRIPEPDDARRPHHASPGPETDPSLEPEPLHRRLSLIHISEPTRHLRISYAVLCV